MINTHSIAGMMPNSDTLIYTVPANTSAKVERLRCTSLEDSNNIWVDVYYVPSGETLGNAYKEFGNDIVPRDVLHITGGILNAGWKVYVKAETASKISYMLSMILIDETELP